MKNVFNRPYAFSLDSIFKNNVHKYIRTMKRGISLNFCPFYSRPPNWLPARHSHFRNSFAQISLHLVVFSPKKMSNILEQMLSIMYYEMDKMVFTHPYSKESMSTVASDWSRKLEALTPLGWILKRISTSIWSECLLWHRRYIGECRARVFWDQMEKARKYYHPSHAHTQSPTHTAPCGLKLDTILWCYVLEWLETCAYIDFNSHNCWGLAKNCNSLRQFFAKQLPRNADDGHFYCQPLNHTGLIDSSIFIILFIARFWHCAELLRW